MVPSLAVTPGGRMWATWYAGITPGQDENNYVVLATSGDGAKPGRKPSSPTRAAPDLCEPSIRISGRPLTGCSSGSGCRLLASTAAAARYGQ